jgi:hypothetical protein
VETVGSGVAQWTVGRKTGLRRPSLGPEDSSEVSDKKAQGLFPPRPPLSPPLSAVRQVWRNNNKQTIISFIRRGLRQRELLGIPRYRGRVPPRPRGLTLDRARTRARHGGRGGRTLGLS